MGNAHRIEIEFDDRCYEALLGEAERLHIDVTQIVERAAVAWVIDMAESTPSTNLAPNAMLVS
jgi:hypothetical protein